MRPMHGFTLLEAIVALTLLSSGLMAAFSWFNQDVRHLIKINDLALQETVIMEALARIEHEDLFSTDHGSYQWDGYAISWQAKPMEAVKQGATSRGGRSHYDVALYDIALELRYHGRLVATPQTRITQFKRVREPYRGHY